MYVGKIITASDWYINSIHGTFGLNTGNEIGSFDENIEN